MWNESFSLTIDDIRGVRRDFPLFGYALWLTQNQRERNMLSVRCATKTIANLVYDWRRTGGTYNSYSIWQPFPFGAITLIPGHIFDDGRARYIDSPEIGERGGWKVVREDNRKRIQSFLDKQKAISLSSSDSAFYGYFDLCDRLIKIYSKLEITEMEILATSRNKETTKECTEFECWLWRKRYDKFLQLYDDYCRGIREIKEVKNTLLKSAIAARQAEVKIEDYKKKIPQIRKKLLEAELDSFFIPQLVKSIDTEPNPCLDALYKTANRIQTMCSLSRCTLDLLFPDSQASNNTLDSEGKSLKDYLQEVSDLLSNNLPFTEDGYKSAVEHKQKVKIHEYLSKLYDIIAEEAPLYQKRRLENMGVSFQVVDIYSF